VDLREIIIVLIILLLIILSIAQDTTTRPSIVKPRFFQFFSQIE